jgi:hypothetical protein
MRKWLFVFSLVTAAVLFSFALAAPVRPQDGTAATAAEDAAPAAAQPADQLKTEKPADQSSPDKGAGDADAAVSEEEADFGLGDDKVEAIVRCLWIVGWVKDDFWLLIGDEGGEKWPFKIIHVSGGAGREIGKGTLHVAGTTTLKVSLAISTEEGTQEIKDFAAVIDVGSFGVLDEAASVAVSNGLAQLAQHDPAKAVVSAWVKRKKNARRWPVSVNTFDGVRIVPGYAEVDSVTNMVLVYPVRMM